MCEAAVARQRRNFGFGSRIAPVRLIEIYAAARCAYASHLPRNGPTPEERGCENRRLVINLCVDVARKLFL
jgi:hypothetical protein